MLQCMCSFMHKQGAKMPPSGRIKIHIHDASQTKQWSSRISFASCSRANKNLWIRSMIISEGKGLRALHDYFQRLQLSRVAELPLNKNKSNRLGIWVLVLRDWLLQSSLSGTLLVLFVCLLMFKCKTRKQRNICCKKCLVDIQLSFITLKYIFPPLDGSPVQSTKRKIKPCNQNAGQVQRCVSYLRC